MSYRRLSRALVLSALLPTLAGCLVEPSPNANAGAGSAAENRAAQGTAASPESRPSPESLASPEASASPSTSPPEPGGKLEAYVRAVAAGLPQEQREALNRVEGGGRRVLALRGYLRAGGGAVARWAWSREHVESYEKSAEYAAALAEIERVRRAFEGANPGYTLRVNTKVRSLDEQLEKWNETDSVARAGDELLERAGAEVASASYGDGAAEADVRRFENFLRGASTRAMPTLAVPGLSPHGQARAFDFQVMRGGELIAGPSSPSEWDSAGWTAKLQEAVRAASTKFSGPLASPREPWHYDYRP
jgi:hypothetical protein